MSRPIKFRAWVGSENTDFINLPSHYEYDDITLVNGKYADVEAGWDIQGTYENVPVEQYTGLKDKNGKEIYEGDIVKVYYKRELVGTYQLVWDDLNAIYELSKTNDYDDAEYVFGGADYRYCVIGNIHENPELLGDGK